MVGNVGGGKKRGERSLSREAAAPEMMDYQQKVRRAAVVLDLSLQGLFT